MDWEEEVIVPEIFISYFKPMVLIKFYKIFRSFDDGSTCLTAYMKGT